MTKTVLGMVAHHRLSDRASNRALRVFNAVPPGREPAWVGRWRPDGRAAIAARHLLQIRDGLEHREEYGAPGSVPRMLWREPDAAASAAAFAAGAGAGAELGRRCPPARAAATASTPGASAIGSRAAAAIAGCPRTCSR